MDIEYFKSMPKDQLEEVKKKLILRPIESAEELQAWIYLFFDLQFPMGVVYPTSTHGPIDAMWRIYSLIKSGESSETPQVCMLASRDSYKTLGAAALEVLCMVQLRLPIAHMAAIKAQSAKAIQYVNAFFRKIAPYLEHHGWKKTSDSKTYMEWITDKDETVYLNIISATIAGANCITGNNNIRTNLGSLRAVDVYKLLDKGEEVSILSFNHTSNKKEYKSISNYWKNKDHKLTYKIKTSKGTIQCSPEHEVFIKNKGYITAKNLKKGDVVLRVKGDRDYSNHGKRLNIDHIKQSTLIFENIKLLSDNYSNNSTDLEWLCSKHGVFIRQWCKVDSRIKNGLNPCQQCNTEKAVNKNKLSRKSVIEHIEANDFRFIDMEEYTNAHDTKIKIKCSMGHIFYSSINNFRNNPRCTKCSCVVSSIQNSLHDFVKDIYSGEIIYNTKNIINPMELDIYIPEFKLGIELDGLYWHSDKVRDKADKSNIKKKKLCEEKDINLLAIYEDEWRDKNSLVKAMIKHRIGIPQTIKLRASKLELVKMNKNKDFRDFFEKYHLDGHVQASFAYGLFYKGSMVSCVSFRKNARHKCWEISRFANNYNYKIHGVLGRVVKKYKKEFNGKLVSFSNNRLSRGGVYEKVGFKEITETQAPSYWYTDFKTRIFRTKCKRINDIDVLSKYPTEKDQALGGVFSSKFLDHNRPLYRIYDYGHRKWMIE